jgi:hypothetical protein
MPEITTIAAPRKKAELHPSTLDCDFSVGDLCVCRAVDRWLDPFVSFLRRSCWFL